MPSRESHLTIVIFLNSSFLCPSCSIVLPLFLCIILYNQYVWQYNIWSLCCWYRVIQTVTIHLEMKHFWKHSHGRRKMKKKGSKSSHMMKCKEFKNKKWMKAGYDYITIHSSQNYLASWWAVYYILKNLLIWKDLWSTITSEH